MMFWGYEYAQNHPLVYLVGADFFIKGCIDIGGGGGLKNDHKREKIDKTHENC